jgi:hypothetical protein
LARINASAWRWITDSADALPLAAMPASDGAISRIPCG